MMICWIFCMGVPPGGLQWVSHWHGWIDPPKLVGVGHTFELDWGTLNGLKWDYSKFDLIWSKIGTSEFISEVWFLGQSFLFWSLVCDYHCRKGYFSSSLQIEPPYCVYSIYRHIWSTYLCAQYLWKWTGCYVENRPRWHESK